MYDLSYDFLDISLCLYKNNLRYIKLTLIYNHSLVYILKKKGDIFFKKIFLFICQLRDLNPRPFGTAPKAAALDHSAKLTSLNYKKIIFNKRKNNKTTLKKIINEQIFNYIIKIIIIQNIIILLNKINNLEILKK